MAPGPVDRGHPDGWTSSASGRTSHTGEAKTGIVGGGLSTYREVGFYSGQQKFTGLQQGVWKLETGR